MNARRCDKCGAFYDLRSDRSDLEITFWSAMSVVGKAQQKDLCPSCTEDLKKWINNEAIILERDPGADNDMVSVPPDSEGF